mmetsp:Transcript_21269/g.43601  ORF Transcript_21269/g.43601 Transcript_21269/m.43601 type:complete len:356 (-) Transcript_21269:1916-2983(-)
MIIGYSLSPGGLLLPYHLGVLQSLSTNNYVTPDTPLAGSSAGSIAVCSHAVGIPSTEALEGTIRISDRCLEQGGARGRLLPLLRKELDDMLPDDAHEIINARPGLIGLAHRELWPVNRPVLATQFETRECLMDAVMDSSTFPFFSTNWPVRLVRRKGERLPRVVVDGFFSVPRERYGCPDFDHALLDDEGNIIGKELDLSDLEMPLLGEVALSEGEVEVSARPKEEKEDYKGTAPGPILYEELDTLSRPKSVVDRTITVCVFPHDTVKFTASKRHDRISPPPDPNGDTAGQMGNLLRLATQASSREELSELYERGLEDAERWVREEEARGWGLNTKERRENYARAVGVDQTAEDD